MTQSLELARRTLLAPAELDDSSIQRVLGKLMRPGVDAADLYFQHSVSESWFFEDGIVKQGSHHTEQGVGVRALAGEKQGFAYSDEIALPALSDAAGAAGAIVRQGQTGSLAVPHSAAAPALYGSVNPLDSWPVEKKLDLLRRADAAARAVDGRITQVMVTLAGSHEVVLVAATDGTFAADVRPLVRLNVAVIAEQQGRREQASAGGGGRGA
jgi:TldD protein